MKHILSATAFTAMLVLTACNDTTSTPDAAAEVEFETQRPVLHVYSARHYDSDRILYEVFEEKAGVDIQVREAKADQLLETMKAEGANSPADVVIAADAGALWRFEAAGLTQPISSDTLTAQIPAEFRATDGHWFGLAKRIRLVAYDPARIASDQVDAWTDLADPALEGEICVRSSSNIYNLSLMAELIERIGAEAAQDWATAVVANMARNPQGGDTDQIKAIAAGECSVAITNHYYWARLAGSRSQSDLDVAEAVALSVPSFPDGGGAHINITGAAVSASATDPDLATDFIAYLISDEGQTLLIQDTKEFPISASVEPPVELARVPAYTPGPTPLDRLGENQAEAQRIYDLAGWN